MDVPSGACFKLLHLLAYGIIKETLNGLGQEQHPKWTLNDKQIGADTCIHMSLMVLTSDSKSTKLHLAGKSLWARSNWQVEQDSEEHHCSVPLGFGCLLVSPAGGNAGISEQEWQLWFLGSFQGMISSVTLCHSSPRVTSVAILKELQCQFWAKSGRGAFSVCICPAHFTSAFCGSFPSMSHTSLALFSLGKV